MRINNEKYFIEKHGENGYCIGNRINGNSLTTGAPHMKSTLYFKTKKEAQTFVDLLDADTLEFKEQWTPKHYGRIK